MSYDPRGPRGPGGYSNDGSGRKGSVKAARERANAAQQYLRTDNFGVQDFRPHQLASQFSRPPTRPQMTPTPPSSSGSNRPIQTSPGPNWPLPATIEEETSRQKGPPPQRPPRPSYVPSILDPSNQTQLLAPPMMPTAPPRPSNVEPVSPSEYPEDLLSPSDFLSPRDNRPATTSSFASNSSLGEIPDFPVPAAPVQSRKSTNLGPPPSARRGPSSYYSQMSYVSPIVEEAESARSHNSFASSNVIPSIDKDFYFDEDGTPSEEDLPLASPSDDGQLSRHTDDGDESGLVRKASVGKRVAPSLTTIKSVDSFDRMVKDAKLKDHNKKGSLVGQGLIAAGAAGGAFAAGYGASREGQQRSSSRPDSEALSSATGLPGPSPASTSTESLNSITKKPRKSSPLAQSDTPDSTVDRRVEQILGNLEKGGALGPEGARPSRMTSLADRVGTRRPPRLNVDAVRDAEARGSLTSLPDLIKRATRLATNLDRGKTASKLGLEMWEKGGDREWEADRARRSGSLSDILSSFPPPGLGTPTGEHNGSRPVSRWPSGLGLYESHYSDEGEKRSPEKKKQGRKCCGVPLWCFIIMITILILLVAAAVIVPVFLIVLPRQNSSSSSSALAACQKSTPCENGGTSVVDSSGDCSCQCTNGYTGERCTTSSDAGCTTATIGNTKNATIGSSIPDLLSNAKSDFDIPLNATLLYTLFSTSNLSCTAENALVTFNGLSSRSINARAPLPAEDLVVPAVSLTAPAAMITAQPSLHLAAREDSSDDAETKLGIVYDASGVTSSATSTATGAAASSSSSNSTGVSSKELEFARIGVLYVFQESQELSYAATAQENLQTYFTELEAGDDDATSATAVNLGNGFTIDISQWHITLENGTTVGEYVS